MSEVRGSGVGEGAAFFRPRDLSTKSAMPALRSTTKGASDRAGPGGMKRENA